MTDDDSGRFNLSRRKMLGSIGVIGAAGAVGGYGTSALFMDEEQVKTTFTAGELDLQLDYQVFHNQAVVTEQATPANIEEGTIIAEMQDIKPGDTGCIVISVHPQGNPAWLWNRIRASGFQENGVPEAETEPLPAWEEAPKGDKPKHGEPEPGNHTYTAQDGTELIIEGELQDVTSLEAAYNAQCDFVDFGEVVDPQDGSGVDPLEPLSVPDEEVFAGSQTHWFWTYDSDTEPATPIAAHPGILLDGDRSDTEGKFRVLSDPDKYQEYPISPFAGDTVECLAYCWRINEGVGNKIQTDSMKLHLDYVAQQARHSIDGGSLENPWTLQDQYPVKADDAQTQDDDTAKDVILEAPMTFEDGENSPYS